MPEATLVEAINLALARAMANDQRVILLGEDIGKGWRRVPRHGRAAGPFRA